MSRYARRIDDNHTDIVAVLEKVGCLVLSIAPVGCGCPDLLVLRAGKLFLLEVKDGAKSPSRRKLTPDQQSFHKLWPVHVVLSPIDALRAVGLSSPQAQAERMGQQARAAIKSALRHFPGGDVSESIATLTRAVGDVPLSAESARRLAAGMEDAKAGRVTVVDVQDILRRINR